MSVNLKVKIMGDTAAESVTKTYRFPLTISVHEACQQIRERMPDGGQDHMLFQPFPYVAPPPSSRSKGAAEPPPEGNPIGVWLKPNRTLESYDLNSSVRFTFSTLGSALVHSVHRLTHLFFETNIWGCVWGA